MARRPRFKISARSTHFILEKVESGTRFPYKVVGVYYLPIPPVEGVKPQRQGSAVTIYVKRPLDANNARGHLLGRDVVPKPGIEPGRGCPQRFLRSSKRYLEIRRPNKSS